MFQYIKYTYIKDITLFKVHEPNNSKKYLHFMLIL